jgi:hypothetical protein
VWLLTEVIVTIDRFHIATPSFIPDDIVLTSLARIHDSEERPPVYIKRHTAPVPGHRIFAVDPYSLVTRRRLIVTSLSGWIALGVRLREFHYRYLLLSAPLFPVWAMAPNFPTQHGMMATTAHGDDGYGRGCGCGCG